MNIVNFITQTVPGLLVIFTPIILGIVELVKKAGMSSRFAPLAALVIGILLGVFFTPGVVPIQYEVLLGVIAGLSAAGLYSGVKTTVGAQ